MKRAMRLTAAAAVAYPAIAAATARKRPARSTRAQQGTPGPLVLQIRQSHLEAQMWQQLVSAGLDVGCQREHVYAPPRKYRADFAWPEQRLLLEVQGGVWQGKSGHSGGSGITRDCDRGNAAALAGWRVLRVTAAHIRTGDALRLVCVGLRRTGEGA